MRRIQSLRLLGDWIYATNLWHINRYSASMAFFVGLFVAFMPIPGQMILAALMAVLLRCNLPTVRRPGLDHQPGDHAGHFLPGL